jgi:ribosomal protein S27E
MVCVDPSSAHDVRVMSWPVRTCGSCAHQDCMRRRREHNVPCSLCGGHINGGEAYQVLSRINGETVSQVHEHCRVRAMRVEQ